VQQFKTNILAKRLERLPIHQLAEAIHLLLGKLPNGMARPVDPQPTIAGF
jgi:hypothetical protein